MAAIRPKKAKQYSSTTHDIGGGAIPCDLVDNEAGAITIEEIQKIPNKPAMAKVSELEAQVSIPIMAKLMGLTYNKESKLYEVDGIQLNEEDVLRSYKYYSYVSLSNYCASIACYDNKTKIVLGFRGKASYNLGADFSYAFTYSGIIQLGAKGDNYGAINRVTACFNYCYKLKYIYSFIVLLKNNLEFVKGCKLLEFVRIRPEGNCTIVNIHDSPKLKYEVFDYLVTNAKLQGNCTIKVHPTTMSYITGEAIPTEQVGGTTEQWQALVARGKEKKLEFGL